MNKIERRGDRELEDYIENHKEYTEKEYIGRKEQLQDWYAYVALSM